MNCTYCVSDNVSCGVVMVTFNVVPLLCGNTNDTIVCYVLNYDMYLFHPLLGCVS